MSQRYTSSTNPGEVTAMPDSGDTDHSVHPGGLPPSLETEVANLRRRDRDIARRHDVRQSDRGAQLRPCPRTRTWRIDDGGLKSSTMTASSTPRSAARTRRDDIGLRTRTYSCRRDTRDCLEEVRALATLRPPAHSCRSHQGMRPHRMSHLSTCSRLGAQCLPCPRGWAVRHEVGGGGQFSPNRNRGGFPLGDRHRGYAHAFGHDSRLDPVRDRGVS